MAQPGLEVRHKGLGDVRSALQFDVLGLDHHVHAQWPLQAPRRLPASEGRSYTISEQLHGLPSDGHGEPRPQSAVSDNTSVVAAPA